MQAAAEGPRATDAFAAVASAFVAGVSAVVDTQEVRQLPRTWPCTTHGPGAPADPALLVCLLREIEQPGSDTVSANSKVSSQQSSGAEPSQTKRSKAMNKAEDFLSLQIGARFLGALAARLEAARDAHDGLACHNLAMVAVHAYLAGLMGPAVMYSLLAHLTRRCGNPQNTCTNLIHTLNP